jgi:type VI secretion system secreted protein VgrG
MADNHISIAGSKANWSAINSDTFLGGPQPGQDQVLINAGNQSMKVAAGQSLNEIQRKLQTQVHDEDEVRLIDQNRATTVAKNDMLTVNQNRTAMIAQNDSLIVNGDRIVAVNNNIKENALNINGDATMNVYIKAGVDLTLEGPSGMIKIDATGVTIQGVLVKIN